MHQLPQAFHYNQSLHKQVSVLYLVTGKCAADTYATGEVYRKMLEYFFKVRSCSKQTDCNEVETASPNDRPFQNPRVPPSHMSLNPLSI